MKILQQTYNKLTLCHRQPSQWLIAGGYFLAALGLIIGASFRSKITCPGGKQTPSCILSYQSFTGLTLERDIQLKSARSRQFCHTDNRNRNYRCDRFAVTLTTDAGEISFPDQETFLARIKAQYFIQNPQSTSLELQSSPLPLIENQPFLFMLGAIAVVLLLSRASATLTNEEIYIIRFYKDRDWAVVIRKQKSSQPPIIITQFPISAIASVDVGGEHLTLRLKSSREVRLATAPWGKQVLIEPITEPPREVNQSLYHAQQEILAFLQL